MTTELTAADVNETCRCSWPGSGIIEQRCRSSSTVRELAAPLAQA
jgi:hypothetical protein